MTENLRLHNKAVRIRAEGLRREDAEQKAAAARKQSERFGRVIPPVPTISMVEATSRVVTALAPKFEQGAPSRQVRRAAARKAAA